MAAGAVAEMGYANLMIYQEGMPDWLMNGYPVKKGALQGTLH